MTGWGDATSVLCVRLDSMGDVLMTTPAIRALKEARPNRRITLLTSPSGVEIARLVPEIDEIIAYEAPWLKATPSRASSTLDRALANRLRTQQFDAAAIFTVFSQNPLPSALLCYWADIPLRLAHCRENPYQLLTHWVPEVEPQVAPRHEVQRQLDLVAEVGCIAARMNLSCQVTSDATAAIRNRLARLGIKDASRWLVVHPGATAASRRYPAEHYHEVVRALSRMNYRTLITGSSSEEELVSKLIEAAPESALPLTSLSLEEMAALVSLAPVLITNNTGPAHLAAALSTPVVDLYALTNPQHTPWQTPQRVLYHDVPCKYCYKSQCPEGHHNCLRLVAPQQVVAAALEIFDPTRCGAALHGSARSY